MYRTPSHQSSEEYALPSGEALLAATLALMTGHVQTDSSGHQALFGKKIVANLEQLAKDPQLSPGFKRLLVALRDRWLVQGHPTTRHLDPHADAPAWHASPTVLQ